MAYLNQKEFLEALHQTALDLLARHDLEDLLQAIVERATLLLEAPLGELSLMSDDALVIRAYQRIKTDWPLVMVGDSRYDPAYAERLRVASPVNTRGM